MFHGTELRIGAGMWVAAERMAAEIERQLCPCVMGA